MGFAEICQSEDAAYASHWLDPVARRLLDQAQWSIVFNSWFTTRVPSNR